MKNLLCIVATWAAVIMSGAAGSAPSQAPAAEDCLTLAYGMMECMGFLAVGGDETTPQESCCTGLKTLMHVNAECMCYALTAAADMGLSLDMAKAKALPSHCGVATPSLSSCHMHANPPSEGAPSLPPPYAIGESLAPAPAPSSSSSVVVPAIFINFLFFIVFALFFVNALAF